MLYNVGADGLFVFLVDHTVLAKYYLAKTKKNYYYYE